MLFNHTVLSRKTISGDRLKIIPNHLSKLLDKKKVIQNKVTSKIPMFFSDTKEGTSLPSIMLAFPKVAFVAKSLNTKQPIL